jgi:hypothetical protein
MKTYRVEYRTSFSQEKPFVAMVEASMRDVAILIAKSQAHIGHFIIVSCKAV